MMLARKIEKISTCEQMLDEGMLNGANADFLESLLKDSDTEYDINDINILEE